MKKLLLGLIVLVSMAAAAEDRQSNSITLKGSISQGLNVFIQFKYRANNERYGCTHKEYRDHVYYLGTAISKGDIHLDEEFTKKEKIVVNSDGTYKLTQELTPAFLKKNQLKCDFRLSKIYLNVVRAEDTDYDTGKEYVIHVNTSGNETGQEVNTLDVICKKVDYEFVCEYNGIHSYEIGKGETTLNILGQ